MLPVKLRFPDQKTGDWFYERSWLEPVRRVKLKSGETVYLPSKPKPVNGVHLTTDGRLIHSDDFVPPTIKAGDVFCDGGKYYRVEHAVVPLVRCINPFGIESFHGAENIVPITDFRAGSDDVIQNLKYQRCSERCHDRNIIHLSHGPSSVSVSVSDADSLWSLIKIVSVLS